MKKKPIVITYDEWINELKKPINQKPEGSLTLAELMEKTGLLKSTLERRLNERIKIGEIETGKFGFNVRWYKQAKKK